MKIARLLGLGLVLILAACSTPMAATPVATPQALRISYPASLQAWAEKLAACAAGNPQVAVYFSQSDTNPASAEPTNIRLEFGPPPNADPDAHLFQVGHDQVVVVVNQANPITHLSSDQLRQIFSGQVLNWESGSGQAIQVWVLPQGEPTRRIFEQAINVSDLLPADAMLAPDPAAMLEAISAGENAIGYLPQSILDAGSSAGFEKIKIVQLDNTTEQLLNQPVLASRSSEPAGLERDLLVCLQNSSTK